MPEFDTQFDVIVIGAGPAGLMAAGQAAYFGARTLLVEKMDRAGRKLRITGKGRCNITNAVPVDEFIAHFGPNGRFLYSAFYQFFNVDLLDFFANLGVQTITERGGRVFPVSNDADDVTDSLVRWVDALGVTRWQQAPVAHLVIENDHAGAARIAGVTLANGHTHTAPAVIIATGGVSYPGTGSTGDGYRLAASAGHTIIPIRPALVALDTAGKTAPQLMGLSLRNVRATLLIDGEPAASEFGEMLFTHFGVSGPIILTLSKRAVDALHAKKQVAVSIDLKPALDEKMLDTRLLRDFDQQGKRQFKTILKDLLPKLLIPVCSDLTGISPDKPGHQITAQERERLRAWLKDFRLEVTKHHPIATAIVTAGGVKLDEVDPRTMQSRLVSGLYFAGEVLDLDADTGGYNLQAAFSTGWLAGRSAASH
ncbi:MAG: NAD(P)/FAD-dependent oxidoreductase [Anaerolineae bacterium]|nr:NAD(P)/FAD-dependent oxidoreductase [Anaerolineae bacterium]